MKIKHAVLASVLAFGATPSLQAQTYQIYNRSNISGATLDWVSMYGMGTPLTSAPTATGVPGLTLSLSDPSWGVILEQQPPGAWHGNFSAGDPVVFAMGPVSFLFNNDIFEFGAQLQANIYGNFTGIMKAYDSADVLLGSASINGVSNNASDGSAVFLGMGSFGGMRRITIEAWDGSNQRAVGVNQASIEFENLNLKDIEGPGTSSVVPEPGTVVLTASGLLGLLAVARRRRSKTD